MSSPEGGWQDPVVGGTVLRIPALQSPNFSMAGQTGWAILQSGLAFFFNVTLSGGTITGPDFIFSPQGLFFYSGPPAAGNLTISIAGPGVTTDPKGNTVQPDGVAIYGAAGAQMFMGIIGTLPILVFPTGASIEGAEASIEAGAAGAGATENLQLVLSGPRLAAAGVRDWVQLQMISDNPGGTVIAQAVFTYINDAQVAAEIVSFSRNGMALANTTAPAAAAGFASVFSNGGYLRYLSGFDGNSYATGMATAFASGQLVNSTSPATVTPFSFNVKQGIPYKITGKVNYTGNVAAGTPSFRLLGPAGTVVQIGFHFFTVGGAGGVISSDWTAFNANATGPTLVSGGSVDFEFAGHITPGADGTLTLAALTSVNADTYNISVNSWMDISPC